MRGKRKSAVESKSKCTTSCCSETAVVGDTNQKTSDKSINKRHRITIISQLEEAFDASSDESSTQVSDYAGASNAEPLVLEDKGRKRKSENTMISRLKKKRTP